MIRQPLGRHLSTTPPGERLDRNWRAIATKLRARRPSWRFAFVALAAVMICGAVLLPLSWRKSTRIEATVIETDADHTQTVVLAEGSRVVLGPSSRLLLVDVSTQHVRLELQRGAIDVDATHREGRTFSVGARQLDVDVVGTQFHVAVGDTPGDVEVSVSRGRVRVTSREDPSHPRFLGAGERWSTRALPPPPIASAAPSGQPVAHDAGAVHEAPPKPSLSPQVRKLIVAGRFVDAYGLVLPDFDDDCQTLGADDLFQLAEAARGAGHPRHAATAFDALRTRFRTDARAPLAALELGRLDLDDLDDPRAAKNALDDVVALQPDGFFREDAEARRVQALEAMGDHTECVAARERYLAAYPHGSHRASVARRCR